jgi:hypothetical protein
VKSDKTRVFDGSSRTIQPVFDQIAEALSRRRPANVCSPNQLQTELASGAEPRTLTVMRTIGYVRVSTDKQAEQGVSLEAQAEKIRAMALVHDTNLLDIIVDGGESAKSLQRPA